jgi:quercetin dioxygenase-like cupin family protein
VRVDAADESVDAGPGELFHFDPGERHSVTSDSGGSVLLFLAPWPAVSALRGPGRSDADSAGTRIGRPHT